MTKEPKNYAYWKSILDNEEKAAEFIVKGSERQKKELKKVFKYMEMKKEKEQADLFPG
ncbi:MAG: hypothetical protein ABIG55_02100 [Candidatus Omnitrophota bacterium]